VQITVLSDVLIARGEIDRLYQSEVPVTLWRAMNVRHNKSPMEFVEKGFVMSNGRISKSPRSTEWNGCRSRIARED
jgi:hypothetical protein